MNAALLQNRSKTILLALIALLLAAILIAYPEQAFKSSLRGLTIWWDVVFPALLPFFIAAEMMMGFGVVHFLGVLLEPLMRPIFRVPGAGAFVMAVGLISGNPMGAKMAARLRQERMISREEGERLVSFTGTAGPLFLFGAVAVGFFESPAVGMIIALAHYAGSLAVGLLMRFYRPTAIPSPASVQRSGFILIRALRAMHQARLRDQRPIGQLLGEAVTSAVQTLLMIGGFIILFSVLVHLVKHVGITIPLIALVTHVLKSLSISPDLASPYVAGLFEMTLGSQLASATSPAIPLLYKLVAVSMIIGWNGLSIHAQVASMISKTDIRYAPYFFARILHGCLAGVATVLLYPLFATQLADLPAFLPLADPVHTITQNWLPLHLFAIIVGGSWLVYSVVQLVRIKLSNGQATR